MVPPGWFLLKIVRKANDRPVSAASSSPGDKPGVGLLVWVFALRGRESPAGCHRAPAETDNCANSDQAACQAFVAHVSLPTLFCYVSINSEITVALSPCLEVVPPPMTRRSRPRSYDEVVHRRAAGANPPTRNSSRSSLHTPKSPSATSQVAGPEDVDAAVAAARHAFDHGPWPRIDPPSGWPRSSSSPRSTPGTSTRWPT